MVQKNCAECGTTFAYEPNPNYPDKRKYCDTCQARKKAEWEAKQAPQQQLPKPVAKTQYGAPVQMTPPAVVNTVVQIVRNERPNSYEFGKAGSRFKIYFDDVADLQEKLDSLMQLRVAPELTE